MIISEYGGLIPTEGRQLRTIPCSCLIVIIITEVRYQKLHSLLLYLLYSFSYLWEVLNHIPNFKVLGNDCVHYSYYFK